MLSPIVEAFAALLQARPGAPVAWTPDGWRDRKDLWALSDEVAAALAIVPAGVRVAISVRRGFVFLAALLAVWRRGDCAVLLDAADPQAPRLDFARQFGAACMLVDEPQVACRPLAGGAPAAGLAAIKLTSGSTGLPRGVGVGAAELVADGDALERTMGIGDGDRVLAAVPMSFSYGVGNLLVPALWRGRVLVLPDHDHPLGLFQALRQGEPTVLPAVPALLRAMLDHGVELPTSLRLVLSAGAVLPPHIAASFRVRFGMRVHAFYGATEAGGICYDRTGDAAERGTVGTPVDGVCVTLDPDGRVRVQSAAVGRAIGVDDSLCDGVFSAPDLGEWHDGELCLLGRVNAVFDVGGHKVHPLEVERVISELDGVSDVVVVPWSDGFGRAVCAALVAARPTVDETAVRRHCVAHLASAKVPRCVLVLEELPRTSRGKLRLLEINRLLGAAVAGEGGRPR
jgi:acyl-coenzyme A synthetase/AMP-(fatty) acid ligase